MHYKRCFVQFPHPGGEHGPDRSGNIAGSVELPERDPVIVKAWHSRDKSHGRKFMQLPGTWIGSDDQPCRGDLWAWGEWEPESRLIRELDWPNPDYPRFLWEPYYVPRADYGGLHNTDPFIFGDCFLYSNCRQ